MHDNSFVVRAASQWRVRPSDFPIIRRRCRSCPSTHLRTRGKFRVNANHKLLDVWLLALCVQCGATAKLTVMERVVVRSIEPALLDGFHDNDPAVAAKLLADPQLARRNDFALDWTDAWTLETTPAEVPKADILDVTVHFEQPMPVKATVLLAAGLQLSRSAVARLVADGAISADCKLTGRCPQDFSFVVQWE